MARSSSIRKQLGTTMIEVLVAMIISVVGLLGLAGFQLRTYASETESFQRANAEVLLSDMVNRISANRAQAADYVANDIGVTTVLEVCDPAGTRAAIDKCEWGNALRGAAETVSGTKVGAMMAARGCIVQISPQTFVVAVVWQGIAPTGAPATVCGKDAYTQENLRRAVTSIVSLANLT